MIKIVMSQFFDVWFQRWHGQHSEVSVVPVVSMKTGLDRFRSDFKIVSRDVFFIFVRPTWNVDPDWCRLFPLFFLNICEGLRRHDKTWHVKQCVTLFVTNSGNSEPCCPTCRSEILDFPGPPGDEGRDQDPLRGANSGESVEHGGTTETTKKWHSG